MEQIISYTELFDFEAIVPVSATTGSGVNDLIGELEKLCQPGGHFFAEDALTDQPERVLAGEIIREKITASAGQRNSSWSCGCSRAYA